MLENVQGVPRRPSSWRNRDRFETHADQLYKQNLKVARLDALFMPVALCTGISFVIAMIVGAELVKTGAIDRSTDDARLLPRYALVADDCDG